MIYTVTLNPAVDRELTVATLEYDTVLRATHWQVDCGGKGFNVARMLAALGLESVALAFAGGRSGELLRDGLQDLGITTDFVWVEGETRTNVSIVSQAHDHYIKVNEPGPTIAAARQAELLDKIRGLAREGDLWVLAGSLPPGVPPTIYADVIESLRACGAGGPRHQRSCPAARLPGRPIPGQAQRLRSPPAHRPAGGQPGGDRAGSRSGAPPGTGQRRGLFG